METMPRNPSTSHSASKAPTTSTQENLNTGRPKKGARNALWSTARTRKTILLKSMDRPMAEGRSGSESPLLTRSHKFISRRSRKTGRPVKARICLIPEMTASCNSLAIQRPLGAETAQRPSSHRCTDGQPLNWPRTLSSSKHFRPNGFWVLWTTMALKLKYKNWAEGAEIILSCIKGQPKSGASPARRSSLARAQTPNLNRARRGLRAGNNCPSGKPDARSVTQVSLKSTCLVSKRTKSWVYATKAWSIPRTLCRIPRTQPWFTPSFRYWTTSLLCR